MKALAFFSDRHVLPGLHVSLLSLLRSLEDSPQRLALFVFADRLSLREKEYITQTYNLCRKNTTLKIIDFSPVAPQGIRTLYGNATVYGRLFLSKLLPEYSECIYLDSDLIVNKSILSLFNEFDEKNILFAYSGGTRQKSLDKNLYQKAGLNMEGPSINSGVLGINLKLWRLGDADELCAQAIKAYGDLFKSCDQSILNVALHEKIFILDRSYNTYLYPTSERIKEKGACVYHLLGSPKPWDLMGSRLNNHYKLWHDIYRETAIGSKNPLRYASVGRNLRIIRSSCITLLKKIKN